MQNDIIVNHLVGSTYLSYSDYKYVSDIYNLNDPDGIHSFLVAQVKPAPCEALKKKIPVGFVHTVEIPCIAMRKVKDILQVFMNHSNSKALLMPLFSRCGEIQVKSFHKFLTAATLHNPNAGLQKVHYIVRNKDFGIFYAGQGIILDREYSPLLLCTASFNVYPQLPTQEGMQCATAIPKNINCYVSPKVLLHPDSSLFKEIIQYYCKMCLSETCHLFQINSTEQSERDVGVFGKAFGIKSNVVISDEIKSFFRTIAEPEKGLSSDTLNACINEYLNAYVEDMQRVIVKL